VLARFADEAAAEAVRLATAAEFDATVAAVFSEAERETGQLRGDGEAARERGAAWQRGLAALHPPSPRTLSGFSELAVPPRDEPSSLHGSSSSVSGTPESKEAIDDDDDEVKVPGVDDALAEKHPSTSAKAKV